MAQVQLNGLLKNPVVRNTAIGIGVAILVPVAVKYLAPVMRPVARSTVKAGLLALEKGRETFAELGEIFDDLVAEVREEMRIERESNQGVYDAQEASPGQGRAASEKIDTA
jgi:hypothetical protein